MRVAYKEQMNDLADALGQMATLAGSAMEKATQSLLQADLLLAEQVISDHDKISELSTIAEERAFTLLALQAPVAGDLRSVVSGIQIVADLVPESAYFTKLNTELAGGSGSHDVYMVGAYFIWQYGPPGWMEDLRRVCDAAFQACYHQDILQSC